MGEQQKFHIDVYMEEKFRRNRIAVLLREHNIACRELEQTYRKQKELTLKANTLSEMLKELGYCFRCSGTGKIVVPTEQNECKYKTCPDCEGKYYSR